METNSKKVLEALPTFDDLLALSNEIKTLSIRKMKIDSALKADESANFSEVMTNTKYFVGGKPVPVSFFDNAYKYKGIDNNLMVLREDLIEVSGELDSKRAQYELYMKMHDFWKTMVYMEKSTM